jgi:hypothetical protein
MSLNFVKAVKSTHRHPINKLLHLIGLVLYTFALFTFASYLLGNLNQNPMLSLALWLTAINLFIMGHMIEDNVRAMTAIILFKYMRFKLSKNEFDKEKLQSRNNNNDMTLVRYSRLHDIAISCQC